MSQKLLFVFNAHSGKGQIRSELLDIVDIMVRQIMRLPFIRRRSAEMQPAKSKSAHRDMTGLCAVAETEP